jgi:hypothetical protein
MQLTLRQRNSLFWAFLGVTVLVALVELFLVLWMVLNGLTLPSVLATLGNGLLAWGIGNSVIRLFGDQFKVNDFVKPSTLRDCFQQREGVIDDVHLAALMDAESSEVQALMRCYLKFFERVLCDSFGSYDYELSVFLDAENPVIACYHDTGGRTRPGSHEARLKNPQYYRDNGYLVVDLLSRPDAPPHVISNTRRKASGYNFTSEEQRQDIGSTILCRLTGRRPAALVVACNQASVFSDGDDRLRQLTHAVSAALGTDLDLCRRLVESST